MPPTHELDHLEDEQVAVLETVHVHGLKLNKDQQLGPVPKYTPWPTMPPALQGHEVDDWMKARILVSKTAETTLVVLVPAKNRLINLAGVHALKQWTFDPQMNGDEFSRWRTDCQTSLQNGREIATVPGLSVNLSPFEGKSESQMELTGEPVRARARCVDDIP